MCSLCNINNFEQTDDGHYRNEFGAGKNIKLYLETKDKKNFNILAENKDNDESTRYTIYRCPTCGRNLF